MRVSDKGWGAAIDLNIGDPSFLSAGSYICLETILCLCFLSSLLRWTQKPIQEGHERLAHRQRAQSLVFGLGQREYSADLGARGTVQGRRC